MADLVSWLTQQIDYDEQLAQAACGPAQKGSVWSVDRDDPVLLGCPVTSDAGQIVVHDEGTVTDEQLTHIALHDPAAVLRQVAAYRRILAEWRDVDSVRYEIESAEHGRHETLKQVLQVMASIYSDREGYDPSWMVE